MSRQRIYWFAGLKGNRTALLGPDTTNTKLMEAMHEQYEILAGPFALREEADAWLDAYEAAHASDANEDGLPDVSIDEAKLEARLDYESELATKEREA